MKILILGGTIFLGRHTVDAALARGHEVVLFNRGKHGADLFPDLEKLRGDRDGGLGALEGRTFDAVVDTCGYVPRIVADGARFLAPSVGRYVFVSTLSVYADGTAEGQDETAPLAELPDPTVEEVTGETYGGLKALCERAVEEALDGRAISVRPGLIVGPHDPTDRFTYWPVRVARGGDVLAPAPRDFPVEFTDVRDLASFLVDGCEIGIVGAIDASGPAAPRPTMETFLDTCRAVAGSDARFAWVDERFMEEHEVRPWMDLPLFPGEENRGLATRDGSAARVAGLTFRPIEETIRDTLAWARTRPADYVPKAGLAPEREAELIARTRAT